MYGKHAYLNELQHAVPTRCSSDLYHYYGSVLWYGVKKRRVSISASHAKSATGPLRTHRRGLYDGRGRPQPLDGWPAGANMRRQDVINGESGNRSEEHTSELQSLMRISYAFFCLKKNINKIK